MKVFLEIDGKTYVLKEVDFNEPTICSKCLMAGVSSNTAKNRPEDVAIVQRAKKGEYVCDCSDPVWINAENPYVGWMPIDAVEKLLKIRSEKLKQSIDAAFKEPK